MKLTEKQLQEFIKRQAKKLVSETIDYKDIFPGADGDFISYLQEVDKFMEDTMDEADKLRDKGKEIMTGNIADSSEVSDRNWYIEARTSFLKQLVGQIVQHREKMRRQG